MKRTTLLLTFMIYFFSVLAEAGVFSSFSSVNSTVKHSNLSAETTLKKADYSLDNTLRHSDSGGHCEESTCHIGHCHHVSTAAFANLNSLINLSSTFSRKPGLAYDENFSNKLKRPPRLS